VSAVQGWYWPTAGPQVTYYIPGPLLNPGKNSLLLLELEETPKKAQGKPSILLTKSGSIRKALQGREKVCMSMPPLHM
jgi:hypothetical protein